MTSDAFVPWAEFHEALTSHVGDKRTVSIFCEETGFHESSLYMWKRQDKVPTEAMQKIVEIKDDVDRTRFKGFHSQKFFRRVVALSNLDTPIKEIARILSGECNRKITIGAVKSARFRFKAEIPGYKSQGAPTEE